MATGRDEVSRRVTRNTRAPSRCFFFCLMNIEDMKILRYVHFGINDPFLLLHWKKNLIYIISHLSFCLKTTFC